MLLDISAPKINKNILSSPLFFVFKPRAAAKSTIIFFEKYVVFFLSSSVLVFFRRHAHEKEEEKMLDFLIIHSRFLVVTVVAVDKVSERERLVLWCWFWWFLKEILTFFWPWKGGLRKDAKKKIISPLNCK